MTEVDGYLHGGKGRESSRGLSVQVLDRHDNYRKLGEWRSEDCKLRLPASERRRLTRLEAERFALLQYGYQELHASL